MFSLFFVFIYIIVFITSSVSIYFESCNCKIQERKIIKMRSHNCILFIYGNSVTPIENHRTILTWWYYSLRAYRSRSKTSNVFHISAPFSTTNTRKFPLNVRLFSLTILHIIWCMVLFKKVYRYFWY